MYRSGNYQLTVQSSGASFVNRGGGYPYVHSRIDGFGYLPQGLQTQIMSYAETSEAI